MAYCGYITRLKNVRKHSNADRLLLADCFGNTVIVSLDYTENQLTLPSNTRRAGSFSFIPIPR